MPMNYYFAPLEGLTDNVYRQLHHKYFPGVDRYYTPFFSPTVHRALTPREARELPPADTLGCDTVPQLLTKVAEDFVWMADQCRLLGYKEVNLNLGCPSGTVTAKGKGSGMLRDPDFLDRFLDKIFRGSPLPISIKTRIGFRDPEEFPGLMEIFNQYPVRELTVHPRVREDFYKGKVHMDAFRYALDNSRAPVCYNGDIRSIAEAEAIGKAFPEISAVMVGRGLIADPGMFAPNGTDPKILGQFMDELFDAYYAQFGSARNTMFRMKEHWGMIVGRFENSEKLAKALRKATDMAQFRDITAQILTLPLKKP